MIGALLMMSALAMPRLEGGATTFAHWEGLLGDGAPLLLEPSPAPKRWHESREVAGAEVAGPTRRARWEECDECRDWPEACGVRCVIQWLHDATAETFRDALSSQRGEVVILEARVEWDHLMAECVQGPQRYAAVLGGVLTTSSDVLAKVPGVLERCAAHEATCGGSLVVCDWLRDETMPLLRDGPPARDDAAQSLTIQVHQQSLSRDDHCNCLLLALFVVLSIVACVRPPPRPLVVEAEPVKV
jgi:hypothetical protein